MKRIYNFFESGDNLSKDCSPQIKIDPKIKSKSKNGKNIDTVFLHLKSGRIITKTFSSKGRCLVGSMKKTGELVISN